MRITQDDGSSWCVPSNCSRFYHGHLATISWLSGIIKCCSCCCSAWTLDRFAFSYHPSSLYEGIFSYDSLPFNNNCRSSIRAIIILPYTRNEITRPESEQQSAFTMSDGPDCSRQYSRQGSSTASASDMDDDIQIEELALNANFDPSFFDVGEEMANDDIMEEEPALLATAAGEEETPERTSQQQQARPTAAIGFPSTTNMLEPTTAAAPRKDPPNTTTHQQQQQQQLQSAAAAAYANPLIGSFVAPSAVQYPTTNNTGFSTSSSFPMFPTAGPNPSPPVTLSSNTTTTSTPTAAALPPFLLFDAPIELRANYMACQRAQGMAVHEDTNQLHYNSGTSQAASVKLVDGRTNRTNKKVRNVREQKRTQKIADLIDQLRVKMEEGGWKVGMKQSKFHTLSSYVLLFQTSTRAHTDAFRCGEYVRHLVKSNKEKEVAMEKTKRDLEAKRRKIEEEKNNTTIGSDRESTTSSLTASSDGPYRKSTEHPNKKRRSRDNQESSHSSSANSSGGDDSGKQQEGQTVSCNRMTSSVSDITGSKGSSSEGNSSEQTKPEPIPSNPNPGSILSDAAVAPGLDATDQVTSPADTTVVVAGSRTSSYTSESTFDLDYKEVFVKSNVPQILATTSGRIVAWNEFFLSATGLRKEDAGRLTIFSLVSSNKLSSLFEIVAAALRTDDSARQGGSSVPVVTDGSSSGAVSSAERGSGSDTSSKTSSHTKGVAKAPPHTEAYPAITLPCTMFQKPGASSGLDNHQLYMTVTLMTDEDPQKRCFHCVFTDCPPGTNGSMSTISRELLAKLVSDTRAKSSNHHHSHKRKRSNRGFA